MPVTTSEHFKFIEAHPSCVIERHEISSAAFSDLRRNLRQIIVYFHETEDLEAKEIADQLRTNLSKWLTVPVRFDNAIIDILVEMGETEAVEARWGADIRSHLENALLAARELVDKENSARTKLVEIIRDLQEDRKTFRIFCHRRSREHFESLADSTVIEALPRNAFIHTVVEYRKSDLFDVLLKVGSLRSQGWGKVPDAILTAPRFSTLIQLVWSGCGDEPGFGFDPVSAQLSDASTDAENTSDTNRHNSILQLNWTVQKTQTRDDTVGQYNVIPDIDDLDEFTKLAQPIDSQRAVLIVVNEDHGILYPPNSKVLSLENDPNTIDYRQPGETLHEGMFLIHSVMKDFNLPELHTGEGEFSRIWKEKLQEKYENDQEDLVNRLRDAGINLIGLRTGIERWCIPAAAVIPAPQQMRHFEILIRVLGIDLDDDVHANRRRAAWWQYAWDEIRRSRGAAIQFGVQEQQVLEEQVLSAVRLLDAEIQNNMDKPNFELQFHAINSDNIGGFFQFYKILAIEEGFRVPRSELKELCELDRIDQWRE